MTKQTTTLATTAIALAAGLTLAGWAQAQTATPAPAAPAGTPPAAAAPAAQPAPAAPAAKAAPGAMEDADLQDVRAIEVLGTVVSVDQRSRRVVLRGPDGREVRVRAGRNIDNLAQVKPGDIVTLSYRADILTDLRKADAAIKPGITVEEITARAKPGDKPAGEVARIITVTGKVVQVDASANTLVVEGPMGELHSLRVRKDANKKLLADLKVGDLIQGTYIEAIALAVTSPDAKKN